ncbi:epididymal-specific lipocalin-9-like isoform X2 [Arvicanthis niloticus]|uniref:epididymal-specific lipocalin-9-like isoform X1 n=1 Tax=Arvicanthis niloticus TaxID=61156 RepID=UPI0014870DBA|nr:epididymal-specific lipocalin-9-like [Arvicanthis niloticus]
MKLVLLLSVGLGLAWPLQGEKLHVSVSQDFHPEQVTGSWHTLKLASTDRSLIEEGGAYLCFMTGIVLLDNGNLNVTYFHREDGKCVKKFYIAEETGTPGHYTFEYQGKNYLTFVDVTEDFTIMDLENQSEGGTIIVSELHGRSLSTDETEWELYYTHTRRRSIVPENIVDLSLSRRCDTH